MNFSEIIQHQIDGTKPPMSEEQKRRNKARRYLKKIEAKKDNGNDPFYFALDGKTFIYVKKYRCSGNNIFLNGGQHNGHKCDILDIERVEFLGYVRQRLERHGSVDYYTHDKSVKSERTNR